jgi:hypothetical protein
MANLVIKKETRIIEIGQIIEIEIIEIERKVVKIKIVKR